MNCPSEIYNHLKSNIIVGWGRVGHEIRIMVIWGGVHHGGVWWGGVGWAMVVWVGLWWWGVLWVMVGWVDHVWVGWSGIQGDVYR